MPRGWVRLALVLAVVCAAVAQSPYYNVPEPLIEALKPRGLRISIPDEPGVELFAVHANINKPMRNLEAGQISQDITKAKNGRWTYEDIRVRLKPGDVINYWLYVQADGLGYRKDDQSFTVKELVDPNSGEPQPVTQTPVIQTPVTKPTVTDTPKPPEKCEQTITTVNGRPSCKGKLIFEENFSTQNPSTWQHVIQIAYAPDYQFVVYVEGEDNSFVKDGKLFIKPTLLSPNDENYIRSGTLDLQSCTGIAGSLECKKQALGRQILPPVQSAKLQTKLSFSFAYGVIEVKAKLPAGDWIFPEIWLEPKDNFYGRENYASGQIRIAFSRGNDDLTKDNTQMGNKVLEAGCRIGLNDKIRNIMYSKQYNVPTGSDFHVYKVIWTADRMVFLVDGVQIGTVSPPLSGFSGYEEFASIPVKPWKTKMAPFDREFYISLGVGVGGYHEFPDGCMSNQHPKPWQNNKLMAMLNFYFDRSNWLPTWDDQKSALEVDYVKVWAL